MRSNVTAADQRSFVGRGGRLEALGFQPRQNESIHGSPRPGAVAHVGRQGTRQRLERPELAIFWANRAAANQGPHRFGGPMGSLPNPLDKPRHFVRPQRFVGGHFQVAGSPSGLNEQAVIGIAGDDGRTAVAPLIGRAPRVEAQARFLLLGSVALDAAARSARAEHGSRTATVSSRSAAIAEDHSATSRTALISAARVAVKDLIVLSERNSVTDRNGAMPHIVATWNRH